MTIISRYDKTTIPWKRTSGIYGHWPTFYKCRGPLEDFGDDYTPCPKPKWHINGVGYLTIITKKHGYSRLWYMGNPYRHKIWEGWPRKDV